MGISEFHWRNCGILKGFFLSNSLFYFGSTTSVGFLSETLNSFYFIFFSSALWGYHPLLWMKRYIFCEFCLSVLFAVYWCEYCIISSILFKTFYQLLILKILLVGDEITPLDVRLFIFILLLKIFAIATWSWSDNDLLLLILISNHADALIYLLVWTMMRVNDDIPLLIYSFCELLYCVLRGSTRIGLLLNFYYFVLVWSFAYHKRRKKVVTFVDTVSFEYTLSSDYGRVIRAGTEWQFAAIDRQRFQRRISQVAEILNPVLLKKLSGSDCIKGTDVDDQP